MATIYASSILERASTIIQDETGTRWPSTELLKWLNDGQREVVLLKPDAYAQNESIALVEGTKQSIPSNGLSLIDVVRNMGADGETPGRAIRLILRRILDDQLSDWHSAAVSAEIKHFTFDDRDPKRFYVYPRSDGTSWVEAVFSSSPVDIAVTTSNAHAVNTGVSLGHQIKVTISGTDHMFECVVAGTTSSGAPTWANYDSFGDCIIDGTVVWRNVGVGVITIDDIYSNSLLDYVLYRAYMKDADYAANADRALAAYAAFQKSLGMLDQKEVMDNPYIRKQVGPAAQVQAQKR